ncbi:hypothetical protein DSO57_1014594 [Entomophthora muscae]|uniref:Uncharacterized protein n=1 Tax=Entomophthora muscae TaxID=34485 RepID=A0ACC2UEX8_9FUNG|nr:hypothetical protein DSO57_1014594 [Entomophthora muscae]
MPGVESLVSLYMEGFKGDVGDFLPHLKSSDSVVLRNIHHDSVDFNISQVAETLEITGSQLIKAINLPVLRSASLIQVHDNVNLVHLKAPLLESSTLNLSPKLHSIDISKNLTWSGRSYFDVNNFCQDYFYDFYDKGLLFEIKQLCLPFCYGSITVTIKNVDRIKMCHDIEGTLTINQDSPDGFSLVILASVKSLVVTDYHGHFSAPLLEDVKERFTLKNTSFTRQPPELIHFASQLTECRQFFNIQ